MPVLRSRVLRVGSSLAAHAHHRAMQEPRPLQQQHTHQVAHNGAHPKRHASHDILSGQCGDRDEHQVDAKLHHEQQRRLEERQQHERDPNGRRIDRCVAAPEGKPRVLQQHSQKPDGLRDPRAQGAAVYPAEPQAAEHGERLGRLHPEPQGARARAEPDDEMRPADQEQRAEEQRQRPSRSVTRAAERSDAKVARHAARALRAASVGGTARGDIGKGVASEAAELSGRAPPEEGHALGLSLPDDARHLGFVRPVARRGDRQRVAAWTVRAVRAARAGAPASARPFGQPRASGAHALYGRGAPSMQRRRVPKAVRCTRDACTLAAL